MWSEPAKRELTVHFASLQLLFFSSVAKTAPLWLSNLFLQSTPPLICNTTNMLVHYLIHKHIFRVMIQFTALCPTL